jgi:hypothetical protein
MKLYWTIYIGVAILSIAGIIGWFLNIAKLISGDMIITGEFILRIIGIFAAPLGSIMGYL